jgi:predicted nucleic acid-binding protein
MKLFLDTSSLIKLYHLEDGTEEIENLITKLMITDLYLSELSKIEFTSAIWKKVRTQEITEIQANETIKLFESDFEKYSFIALNHILLEQARHLTIKYGKKGLRTLDSIQLATAIFLKQDVNLFFTADKLLLKLFEDENLPVV